MVIAGLDTETTGFDFFKGDRIIEACFGIYQVEHDGIKHLKSITQRINPERSIPADAQAVHGISLESLKESPTWKDFAPKVDAILSKVDLLVIHNAEFDMPFLYGEQERAGYKVDRQIPTFCTMANGRWATFDGKSPQLRELCWSLGVDYDPSVAHAADYDVSRMMACYEKGIELGFYPSPIKR